MYALENASKKQATKLPRCVATLLCLRMIRRKVVITDGGEEFTDSAMEALRRNLEKNSCNLSQGGGRGEERVMIESGGDDGDGDAGGTGGIAPRYPQRSAGTGVGHNGSVSDKREHDDGDEDVNNEGNGNGDDVDADADIVVGGCKEEGGARGAEVLLERLTWGEHAEFLKRNGGGGGGGGSGGGDGSSAVVDCEGEGGGHGGVSGCGGGGGPGFDFIVAADVICELLVLVGGVFCLATSRAPDGGSCLLVVVWWVGVDWALFKNVEKT